MARKPLAPVSEIITDLVPVAEPIADRLRAGFERRIADFAAAARRVRAGSDSAAIHDLRVSARRLLAALRVWRALLPVSERRSATRELRRLRRRVGRARELEVHVELLEERLSALDDAMRAAAAAVLGDMKDRRDRRVSRAVRRVRPRRSKRLFGLLEDLASEGRSRLLGHPNAIEAALRVEREARVAAREALRNARDREDDASLHEARIEVKKWRYAIECVEEVIPGPVSRLSRRLEHLRQIQEALGVAHDHALLRDALMRYRRDRDHPGYLQALIDGLDVDRRRAVLEFQRLAGSLHEVPESSGGEPSLRAVPADETREERWDRMAQWLARAGRGEPNGERS